MQAFRGSLYIGTGIQNGDFDLKNNTATAAEIVRLEADLGKGARRIREARTSVVCWGCFSRSMTWISSSPIKKVQFGEAVKVRIIPEHGGNERGKRPQQGRA